MTPSTDAHRHIRLAFDRKLLTVRKLRLKNEVDSTTPSLDFTFISDYATGLGVYRGDPEAHEGCSKPCKANMGSSIGCEWPRACKCLEYAAVDEDVLRREDPKLYLEYQRATEKNEYIDTTSKFFTEHSPVESSMMLTTSRPAETLPIPHCQSSRLAPDAGGVLSRATSCNLRVQPELQLRFHLQK